LRGILETGGSFDERMNQPPILLLLTGNPNEQMKPDPISFIYALVTL